MDELIKNILNSLNCKNTVNPIYTEEDLLNISSCVPVPSDIIAQKIEFSVNSFDTCINSALLESTDLLVNELNKQNTAIIAGLIKGKVEEALDNYKFIYEYYNTRVKFFMNYLNKIEPYIAKYLYYSDEYTNSSAKFSEFYHNNINLLLLNPIEFSISTFLYNLEPNSTISSILINSNVENLGSIITEFNIPTTFSQTFIEFYNLLINKLLAYDILSKSKEIAIQVSSESIGNIQLITESSEFLSILNSTIANISGQILVHFENSENTLPNGITIPKKCSVFGIRLIDLHNIEIELPEIKNNNEKKSNNKTNTIKYSINCEINPFITNDPFKQTSVSYCEHIDSTKSHNSKSNYKYVPGLLYNKTNSTYEGYYNRIGNPIKYLYSLEERGLSLDKSNTDILFNRLDNTPSSFTEDEITYYISNISKYENFYKSINSTLPDRLNIEKTITFPNEIFKYIEMLHQLAISEVATLIREIPNFPLKLARSISYTNEIGAFVYSNVDSGLAGYLSYYENSANIMLDLIDTCTNQITILNDIIKSNTMDSNVIKDKLLGISCFSNLIDADDSDCSNEVMKELGIDPLCIRTLDSNDITLPDISIPCYWREFANSLSRLGIFPIPDSSGTSFRYYPITNIIPTPSGLSLIPTPQKWVKLFNLSTSLGSIVFFITIPYVIIGIPLPSVYIFYFAPDGMKYLLFAPNVSVLYSSPKNSIIGFELDKSSDSDTPIGLSTSNSNKGRLLKNALTIPLALLNTSGYSSRLAEVTSAIALNKNIIIKDRGGNTITEVKPDEYLSKYTTMYEKIKNSLDDETEFNKIVLEFKRNINKQFDKLGKMPIPNLSNIKNKIADARLSIRRTTEFSKNSEEYQQISKTAASFDNISIDDKISAITNDISKYLDKIKLGDIKIPSDPSKLNPKLPSYISALLPIIEAASKGLLMPDIKFKSFTKKLKIYIRQLEIDKLIGNSIYDLLDETSFLKFKSDLSVCVYEGISQLMGNSSNSDNSLGNSNTLRAERIKLAFSLISASLNVPSIDLFNPAAKCCKRNSDILNIELNPLLQSIISSFIAIFDSLISAISKDQLLEIIPNDNGKISSNYIISVLDTFISSIPDITLPEKPDLNLITTTLLTPFLSVIDVPESPNPLGLPMPIQTTINMDSLIKPTLISLVLLIIEAILKLTNASDDYIQNTQSTDTSINSILYSIPCKNGAVEILTNSIESNRLLISLVLPINNINFNVDIPSLPLDIFSNFYLLTPSDIIEFIKSIIFSILDKILDPIAKIVNPILNISKSLKDISLNPIEIANPYILPPKLLEMGKKLLLPMSSFISISNIEAMNSIKKSYIELIQPAEQVLSEVSYLGAISLCAFGGSTGILSARTSANLIFNQDDLPPWERLTHKNPLFAIFLDEINWRCATLSTGTLLFQSKKPAIYPSTWSPSIYTDDGAHL